jgi:type II secretory pathway component HofQ
MRAAISGLALSAVFAGQSLPPDLPVTRLDGVARSSAGSSEAQQRALPLAPLPITQLEDRVRVDLDGPRGISLTISRPMPLPDLLLLLVNGTPFSIVADKEVSGTIVGDLKDLSMRQALEAVLFSRGLDYDVQATLIRVFPRQASMRFFDVNYVNVRRTWQRSLRSVVSFEGRQPAAAAELTAAAESDPVGDLRDGVQALLSETGRMHLDGAAGVLQVTDFSDRLDRIAVYVEAVQLRASRQVRLDARVFEVDLNDAGASAIDWKAVAARSAASMPPPPAGAAAGLTAEPETLMKAIAEQGTIRMIAAPHVVALNNEPAVMRVGTQSVAFDAATTIAQDGSRQRDSRALPVLEGLTLTVTAQIASDGIVQLSVSPTYASRRAQAKSPDGGSVPVLRVQETDTTARVRDGETIVLSGFFDERDITRPGAGVSGLFGAQVRATKKSELVILLTPTVVVPGAPTVLGLR